jgi:predicted ABC-type ATPase
MAYKTADHVRREQLDFIVGFEVHTSKQHPIRMPQGDICDDLKGKYPKGFVFVGWHTCCMCYTTTILPTPEEFSRYQDALLAGEDTSKFKSVNAVKEVPKQFHSWTDANTERGKAWKSQPYFIRDNFVNGRIEKGLKPVFLSQEQTVKNLKLDFENTDHLNNNIDFAKSRKVDTSKLYRDANGNWLPERAKLHDEIINSLYSEAQTSEGTIFTLGGATANGKSTLTKSGLLPHSKQMLTVDSDKIKGMLPEYKHMINISDKAAAKFVHEESGYISKQVMSKAIANKKDFILDAVNDGEYDKLVQKIEGFRANGSRVRADYVSLNTETSIKLAAKRAAETGREVPMSYILETNKEVSAIVPKLIKDKTFDELYLWDTNINKNPRLILKQIEGKLTIYDQQLYNDFLKKAL